MSHSDRIKVLRMWIPAALLITFFCLVTFAAVQQNIRSNANDPQIQLAEDTANYLTTTGADPKTLVGIPIDIRKSIAPFGNIYNEKYGVLAGGGSIDGQAPIPPAGVFEYVLAHGEDRFTWEPAEGVRIAAVMTKSERASSSVQYVLLGRSMREIEIREHDIAMMIGIAWIVALVIAAAYSLVVVRNKPRHE
ncbi:MAG: hypothetical protein JWL80_446 [Parcubacteria group bacterium]|nr:hypothetical protein [Parcubacteria group bacterium]